jgi:riboflavin synthase
VVEIANNEYRVTAIDETIQKTTLGHWKAGDEINLERCLRVGDRLDGHNVQGHVDLTATCERVEVLEGSWKFHFTFEPKELSHVTVPKGSVAVNGVSLTVVDSSKNSFSVAIIPYTFEHTQFKHLKAGMPVNLEFDVIGKYVARYAELLRG